MSTVDISVSKRVSVETIGEVMARIAREMPLECEAEDTFGSLEIVASDRIAWGIEVSLSVRAVRREVTSDLYEIVVDVNAPATHRSPPEAVAFANLYQDYANAACLAESIHRGHLYPLEIEEQS